MLPTLHGQRLRGIAAWNSVFLLGNYVCRYRYLNNYLGVWAKTALLPADFYGFQKILGMSIFYGFAASKPCSVTPIKVRDASGRAT
jgi:hypothetical protein